VVNSFLYNEHLHWRLAGKSGRQSINRYDLQSPSDDLSFCVPERHGRFG